MTVGSNNRIMGSGVWVARDLWRAIRTQMDHKVSENEQMREQYKKVVALLKDELDAAHQRMSEMEIQFRRTERIMQEDLEERTLRANQLQNELEMKVHESDNARREYQSQTDKLTDMLKTRDQAESKADTLTRSLDETAFRLKLENHRHTLSTSRVGALEKELAYYKERHQNDLQRIESYEAKLRDGAVSSNELKLQIDAYKEVRGGGIGE